MVLLGNHCKRATTQPKHQRKKSKTSLPNDEELGKIIHSDDTIDYSINSACKLFKQQFPSVKGLSLKESNVVSILLKTVFKLYIVMVIIGL